MVSSISPFYARLKTIDLCPKHSLFGNQRFALIFWGFPSILFPMNFILPKIDVAFKFLFGDPCSRRTGARRQISGLSGFIAGGLTKPTGVPLFFSQWDGVKQVVNQSLLRQGTSEVLSGVRDEIISRTVQGVLGE
jgi:hypothetical protein